MADNTILNVGTAGDVIRNIDKLGKKTQVVALDLGGAGAESLVTGTLPVSGSVSVANFPADVTLTDTQLRATPVTVTGSRLNSGVSTAAGNTHLTIGGSDGTNLRPLSTDNTGKVNVLGTFFQATQPVSIAASVAVTGALTDTQIRATALPVSGTFFQATQPVSLAANTPDVTDRAGRLIGTINNTGFAQTNNSLVSTLNSSTTNLALNAVFTGTGEDVSEYSTIMVTVFADQLSAIDGLSMQQSSNGTNWDISDVYSIPLSSGKVFSVGVVARFFRIVYTNGATATTAFRLQVIYSKQAKKNSSVRPQDGRTNDNDFEENLAYGMVWDGTVWNRLRGTIASGVTVSGSRLNNGTSNSAGSTHLTIGGSDGTNLRPISTDTTGKLNVLGTFFQATQPVSAISLPLPTGASSETTLAALNTKVTAVNTGAVVISGALPTGANTIGALSPNQSVIISDLRSSVLHISVTGAVNTAVTASLPAAAGGIFHYITSIQLVKLYAVIGVASGAGVVVTTTNMPGGFAWTTEQVVGAAGAAVTVIDYKPTTPLKASSPATITTFVAPAQLQTIWRWNISYYTVL